ncbi:MAG TPA: hypothetical protein VHL11_14630 [Phototrophicaceae bacterium]|jgi:hypothetical protein|nr:hypothetical protein [Phototrophicaceae bacterium]
MHTSTEAVQLLQDAVTKAKNANQVINDLIVEHDYQDVAALITQAAASLLESASLLMQSKDEAALSALESADDLLDEVYTIIDSETDED